MGSSDGQFAMGRQAGQNIDAAQAVSASAAQMELAVREVEPAVEQLGSIIGELANGLMDLRKARPRQFDPELIEVFPDEFDRIVNKLEKLVHTGIVQMQFYDRLVQHMTHLQAYLSGTAGQLAVGDDEAGTEEAWWALRSRLRVRLISQAQRDLLDAVLPPPEGGRLSSQQARDEHAAQGTVELF